MGESWGEDNHTIISHSQHKPHPNLGGAKFELQLEGVCFKIEFIDTVEGVMIFPGAILAEVFGRHAVSKIVSQLGGTTRKGARAKVLLHKLLDFVADPNSRATLWRDPSWNDCTSNNGLAKLRGVGIAIIYAKLKRGNFDQITMRQFNTLPPELVWELNAINKFDIETFARSAHNLFEHEGEVYEQADAEMVTPNAHERSSERSTCSSAYSPEFESSAPTGQSSKRTRLRKKAPSFDCNVIVPSNISFDQALVHVRSRLLPSMQGDDEFVNYATRRAIDLQQTLEGFYSWVEQEDEKRRKQTEYEDENARKQEAFENEEARKQELHEIEKNKANMKEISGESSEDDHDTEPKPLMAMRMKRVLNDTLSAAGSFQIKCPTPDCDHKISPLIYCVCGPDLQNLRLSCVECAENSGETFRRKIEMPSKRALVYLYHAGTNIHTTCALCDMETEPINVITSDWEMAHKVSDKLLGKDKVENLFPAHPVCNGEQHMRSLYEVRKTSGFTTEPFPNGFRSLEKAKQARHRILC